ncbi:MAG: PTS sugar transporter subunit IIC [Erysipelotrichaceae bacterium]|jgi:PTS system mannose-specific IIC component|nr:PTS sugar transporter subunit IIC [Erysipelotrichaceae bacterium]MBQ1299886.1 PTS sugar transporter subunit IIC [Erysipelotrichaceae bacterium]MBQ1303883.1 PTS sugar transporter subunit IIC [Erysipelotrichaceae bacterium]MBQ2213238.1 PTS sugar transporter subunit IIC [Erysipelotrichaceae bacterium]MBR2792213.1 PTS sugar transporter subunit IIC [Erysipelotrichaceae bacterium]
MSTIQIIFVALFVYLGSIGSIVGNTIGWYALGRPLVASFVVGIITGDVQDAMVVGIPLQIMYMGSVTPGGAVAWDLSYATYIGTAGAIMFGKGAGPSELIGYAVLFAGIGGFVGQLMWNLSYALNLPLNRLAKKYADAGDTKHMYIPNVVGGQLIGFACRFIPAVIVLSALNLGSAQADFANMIPGWLTQFLSVFGGMMAALGMGIILSFLVKKGWHYAVFLAGFILVTYFNLSTMAVAVIATIVGVVFYAASTKEA